MDLIDFQSLKTSLGFKWVMQYQDHFTKFCVLRPLKSKCAAEVALNLIDIKVTKEPQQFFKVTTDENL